MQTFCRFDENARAKRDLTRPRCAPERPPQLRCDPLLHVVRLPLERLGGRGVFLDQRRVALRHLVHFGERGFLGLIGGDQRTREAVSGCAARM
jgi:hypothetical protein